MVGLELDGVVWIGSSREVELVLSALSINWA